MGDSDWLRTTGTETGSDSLVPSTVMRSILGQALGVDEQAIDLSYPSELGQDPGAAEADDRHGRPPPRLARRRRARRRPPRPRARPNFWPALPPWPALAGPARPPALAALPPRPALPGRPPSTVGLPREPERRSL